MTSDAQRKASAKYDATRTKQVKLKLNIQTDQDIIERLAAVGNKQGYIKRLVRLDIKREGQD